MFWSAIGAMAALGGTIITFYELRLRRRNKRIEKLEDKVRRLERRVNALHRLYRDVWTRMVEASRRGGRRYYDP